MDKKKRDNIKFETILLTALTMVFVISMFVGHQFNKGTYGEGPNDKQELTDERK